MMKRIVIAVMEPVLAVGLEAILKKAGFEIADVCTDIAALFESIQRTRPDIAIIHGIVAGTTRVVRDLRSLAPQCQLVLWGGTASHEVGAEAMRLGASGLLPANISPAELIEVLEMLGSFPIPPAAPGAVVKNLCDQSERQLLALVAAGMKNDEIAAILHYDESAVNRLVKEVSYRLGAQDRYELALYGLSAANNLP